MKLYYMPGACSLASHIVLEWTGAPCESIKLNRAELKTDDYLRINPAGAVPALEIGGDVITQNAGILNYLAKVHPDAKLIGDGTPRGEAEVQRWLGFVNSEIHPAFKPLFGATAYLGDETMIEKTRVAARTRLRTLFELVDKQLKGHDWIAGPRSIADAYLFVMLRWAHGNKIDLSGLNNVARYYAQMQKDAGVVAAMKGEGLS